MDWSRRKLLSVGGLVTAGLALPRLLFAESLASSDADSKPGARADKSTLPGKAKSCILFFMEGGPSHIDYWDLKPEAPEEIRGPYQPISTSVPGLQISDQLPSWAPIMEHLAVIRSVSHKVVDHNAGAYYTVTGHQPTRGAQLVTRPSRDNFPPIGSVLAKLQPTDQPLPDFIHIPKRMFNSGSFIPGQLSGFLGDAYDPLITGDPSVDHFQIPGLQPLSGLDDQRLADRRRLLSEFRGLATADAGPVVERMNRYYDKAFSLVTSPEVREAFNWRKEPQAIRERYGCGPGQKHSGKLGHLCSSLLLARRLIEAGVRLVTVWAGDQVFDTHKQHYATMKKDLSPYLNIAFAALIKDLVGRGMLDETLVVAMGEFGRTPRMGQITSAAGATLDGRDHWPNCYTLMLAGGGIQPGAVWGASDRLAANPVRDRVTPEDVMATIYAAMGVNPEIRIRDSLNRPHTLVDGTPIGALL